MSNFREKAKYSFLSFFELLDILIWKIINHTKSNSDLYCKTCYFHKDSEKHVFIKWLFFGLSVVATRAQLQRFFPDPFSEIETILDPFTSDFYQKPSKCVYAINEIELCFLKPGINDC